MMKNYKLFKGAWKSIDCNKERELTAKECRELLRSGGVLVRNVYDFDCNDNTSFWYVIKDSFGGMEELSSKKRNQVKKSFKMCDVRKVNREEMIINSYDVYKESAKGYKIKAEVPSKESLTKRFSEKNAETHDYWAVYEKENCKMIAFAINGIHDDYISYDTMKAIPSYLRTHYPYYGMIWEMNRYYLNERGYKFVNDGARSITEHSNIQPFLIDTFNFRKAYCHLKLTYKWWLWLVVKILYPFRKVIKGNLQAILKMEAMARGEV